MTRSVKISLQQLQIECEKLFEVQQTKTVQKSLKTYLFSETLTSGNKRKTCCLPVANE